MLISAQLPSANLTFEVLGTEDAEVIRCSVFRHDTVLLHMDR